MATGWSCDLGLRAEENNRGRLVRRKGLVVKYKTANVRIKVTTAELSCKAVSVADCECVFVASVTQLAKRMRCITLSSLAYLALTYFSHLSHK